VTCDREATKPGSGGGLNSRDSVLYSNQRFRGFTQTIPGKLVAAGVGLTGKDVFSSHNHGKQVFYAELTEAKDAEGNAGDITWNFEKFLVSPEGNVVARYRPQVEPEDPAVVADIEAQLTA